MIRITASIDAAWERANVRAIEQAKQGRRPVYAGMADGRHCYRCQSSKGDGAAYVQTILNLGQLQASCTCPAGQHPTGNQHCWHTSAALLAETIRLSNPARFKATYEPAPVANRPSREEVARRMARFGAK